MTIHFPENKYMVSIVEPIGDGRRQDVQVEVYERLDTLGEDRPVGGVQHVRFVGDFPLYDPHKNRNLYLDEVTKKISEIVGAKR